jgi:hypothetical protein
MAGRSKLLPLLGNTPAQANKCHFTAGLTPSSGVAQRELTAKASEGRTSSCVAKN